MGQTGPGGDGDFQRQIDDLRARVARHRVDIDALESRADTSNGRADASERHADMIDAREDVVELRSDYASSRISELEARVDINEKVLAELQMEGLIRHDQAVHMQEALLTSRTIGAAIGIIMATRKVSEVQAFAMLSRASHNTNRKVRALASDIVASGDVTELPHA